MKFRPQIGLRLMMLLVALVAAIIGWRTAVEQLRRENRAVELKSLRMNISQQEKLIDWYKKSFEEPDNGWNHAAAKDGIKNSDKIIADTKKSIEELSK